MNSDKFIDIIASMVLGEAVFQLPIYFFLGSNNFLLYIVATIGSMAISGPIIYYTVGKIRKKKYEEERKRFNCIKMAMKELHELEKEDKLTVNQETCLFHKRILDILQRESIVLSMSDVCTLNDLVYLINANYYYEIFEKINLDRNDVIERIILQVALYLKETTKRTLNDKDIEQIINNCFFIKNNTKEEIIKEFKNSTCDFDGFKQHGIENRYIGTEKVQKKIKNKKIEFVFDINNTEHYKMLIEGLTAADTYLREYGNIDNIEWDYEVLKEVFSIMISKFKSDLKELDLNDYSEFEIASSYFYNIMCYSVMNKKDKVDYQTMLATFKDWSYLPFKIKIDMATAIITELDLKEVKHPYLQKVKSKEKAKIYHYPNNDKKS